MSTVVELDVPGRPETVALISAIEDAIYQIAPDKMTPIEVLGVLDMVSKQFYQANFKDAE